MFFPAPAHLIPLPMLVLSQPENGDELPLCLPPLCSSPQSEGRLGLSPQERIQPFSLCVKGHVINMLRGHKRGLGSRSSGFPSHDSKPWPRARHHCTASCQPRFPHSDCPRILQHPVWPLVMPLFSRHLLFGVKY